MRLGVIICPKAAGQTTLSLENVHFSKMYLTENLFPLYNQSLAFGDNMIVVVLFNNTSAMLIGYIQLTNVFGIF